MSVLFPSLAFCMYKDIKVVLFVIWGSCLMTSKWPHSQIYDLMEGADLEMGELALRFSLQPSNQQPVSHELCWSAPLYIGIFLLYNFVRFYPQASGQTYEHNHRIPALIMEKIKPVFRALAQPELLKKCLHGQTPNVNESFNALIWQRAPQTGFCGKTTLKIAVYDSLSYFNDGNA